MKRSIVITLFIVAMAMAFTSCSTDENETDIQNEEESSDDQNEETSIVGTWLIQSAVLDGEDEELDSCDAQATLTFEDDGTMVDSQPYTSGSDCIEDSISGTYSVETDKITFVLNEDGTEITSENDFEIDGDILTVTYVYEDEGGATEVVEYLKQ